MDVGTSSSASAVEINQGRSVVVATHKKLELKLLLSGWMHTPKSSPRLALGWYYTTPLQICWYTVYSVVIVYHYFHSHQTRQSPSVSSIGIRAVSSGWSSTCRCIFKCLLSISRKWSIVSVHAIVATGYYPCLKFMDVGYSLILIAS